MARWVVLADTPCPEFTPTADLLTTDTSKLGECEFSLIAEMNSQMIVHHPYRTLLDLQSTFPLTPEETALAWYVINDHYLTDLPLLYPPHVIAVVAIFMPLAMKTTQSNGGASTPVIASTAVITGAYAATNAAASSNNFSSPQAGSNAAGTVGSSPTSATTPVDAATKAQRVVSWLADGDIDMEALVDCTQEIISLYDVWEQYNEKVCKEQITRFVKARGLDK